MLKYKFIQQPFSRSILNNGRIIRRYLQTSQSQFNKPAPKNPDDRVRSISRDRLRNIGIVAHINAGKTTTTERILYHAGSTNIVGDVDKGNTVTDYLVQERDRGITITSAAVTFDWKKHRINLIDTPGHVDFTIEVERSLSVLDGAITLIDASAGVEAQTVTVWNQASKYKLPNIIFLNKYDKRQADYRMCLKDLKTSLEIDAPLIQIPIVTEKGFSSIIDIINRQYLIWSNPSQDHGSKFVVETSAGRLDNKSIDMIEEEREKLVNLLTDLDDTLASHVLECDKISDVSSELLIKSLRKATLSCDLCPVLIGSSFKYIGVQQLMDSIVNYLPSPIDRERQIYDYNLREMNPIRETIKSSKNELCAFIFKIMHDKRLGALSYLRVCNGSLSKLQRVQNLETRKLEQVKKVYKAFADELRELDSEVGKDDIVVVTGLTESRTGDILVDQNFKLSPDKEVKTEGSNKIPAEGETIRLPFQMLNKEIIVPQISAMEPVYFCSIESRNSAQQLKLERALDCLSREDPSFTFYIDQMGITTIRGMGKLHLEVIRDRIESEYGIEPLLGPLQISYRETIEGSATEELSVSRLVNSVNNSLQLKLYVRSKPKAGPWTAKQLRLDLSGDNSLGRLRTDHRKALEMGFVSALMHGPTMGYPIIDCDVLLLDFKANGRCGLPIISSTASQCLMAAIRRSSPLLLEPIMLLEVVSPAEHNGAILGDLQSTRRALLLSTVAKNNGSIVIRSEAPLSTLADYSEFLRICTSGRGSFSMELCKYKPMSESDKQSVVRL